MITRDIEMGEMVEVPVEPQTKPGKSCSQTFSNWFDPDFFKSVVNPREIFCPMNWKKPLWWGATVALAGGVIALEATTGALSAAATYNNVGIMAVLYAVDPIVQSINIITAKYPPALPQDAANDDEEIAANIAKNADVAVVIPAHLAADKIEATIRSALRHVKPEQIFILDNGNSEQPLDNTREIVNGISEKINYVWGHIGNKTFGQYIGTLIAKYKYIYTSDDDMLMPRNFSFGIELMNDEVKAVCYPITAVHSDPDATNILIRWQSLEYKLSDCAKLSQARFSTVLYPHGAASMWDREVFIEVLKMHDAVFYAEDVKLGMLLEKLGYRMAMAAGACLKTVAPTTLFGSNPNLYQQRTRSWEMGRQAYFHKFLLQLLIVMPPTKSPIDFTFLKLAEAYAVYTNTVDWFRMPLFLLMFRNPDYWIRLAILVGAGNIPVFLWNYIKLPLNNRRDLQSGFLDILTYPAFKLIESGLSIGGIGRFLTVYGPNYVHKPNVVEREKSIFADREKLEADIRTFESSMENPPLTYKNIMYGRFFQAAMTPEEIESEFVANTHALPHVAMVEETGEMIEEATVIPASVAIDIEMIEKQFTDSTIYCDDLVSPNRIHIGGV